MISQIQNWLLETANRIPVEQFVAIGSAVEEIIAPIPSPVIMTISGSIAQAQLKPAIYLIVLAAIGSLAKTAASWFIYFISDKAEDLVVTKLGKYVGISHKEVEKIGQYFSGSRKDMFVVLLARAIPIIPTAPVSIVAGVVKLNLHNYLLGTFLGTIIRNLAYLLLGYYGTSSAASILDGLDSLESIMQLILVAIAGSVLVYLFYKREKQTDLWGQVKKIFAKENK